MTQDKRTIIINEIQYWKTHKLLPEQYCDFLLNLYGSDGKEKGSSRFRLPWTRTRGSTGSRHHVAGGAGIGIRSGIKWALALGVITIISVIGFYFNAFPLAMQIISGSITVVAFLLAGILLISRHLPFAYLSLGTGCFLLLLIGEWLLKLYQLDEPLWALGYLFLCCLVWLGLGIFLRLIFLQLCGFLGMAFIYGWLLMNLLDPLYGVLLQLAWMVTGALCLWGGWMIRNLNRSLMQTLIAVAVICFVAPELMAVFLGGAHTSMFPYILFTGKLAGSGIAILILRKRWIGWVVNDDQTVETTVDNR